MPKITSTPRAFSMWLTWAPKGRVEACVDDRVGAGLFIKLSKN